MLFVTVVLPSAIGACADCDRAAEYNRQIERGVRAYRHRADGERIAAELHDTATREGYEVGAIRVGDSTWTAWRTDGEARSRLELRVERTPRGHTVVVMRDSQALGPQRWEPASVARDHALEHVLLSRLAPEAAARLEPPEASRFVYAMDAQTLSSAIAETLAARGELWPHGAVPIDVPIATEWIERDRERVRHSVLLSAEGPRKYRVEIREERERAVGTREWVSAGRAEAIDLELALIRKLDPHGADAIEAEATRRADEAYEAAVARGQPSCAGCAAAACSPPRS